MSISEPHQPALVAYPWSNQFGAGSLSELASRYAERRRALEAGEAPVPEGVERSLRNAVERDHFARYGADALRAELADEQERDAATTNDAALVAYIAKWSARLGRFQRVRPALWRVRELSDEEVRDLCTLRLLEAVKAPRAESVAYERAGKEWGRVVLEARLRSLRKSFALRAEATDFRERAPSAREPTQEERWLEREAECVLFGARDAARARLSRPQRRWLAAFELSARGGNFFAASAEPNLSAAARVLGRNRSSAQRAYRELQATFGKELAKRR